jgi:TonB family protein
MMQQAIDRSAQTGGSFLASIVVHALLLLLLTLVIGRAALEKLADYELTHIAYIEARYGEDVAEKVKLKELPSRKLAPGPPGPGITTDSAVNKAKPAAPDIAPQPKTLPEPDKLEPRLAPAPQMAPPPQLPAERPQLAAADVPALAPTVAAPPRELAVAAATLEARTAPAPVRQVVDTERLERALAGQLEASNDKTPRPAAPPARQTMKPANTGLQDRGGRAPVGNEPTVAAAGASRPRGGAIAEAAPSLGGGNLSARTPAAGGYNPPAGGLAPAGTARGSGSPTGILDATVPEGGGGSVKGGRKTILDYGTGGGGGGGLSERRGRIAEVPASRDIVASAAAAAAAAEPAPKVAEARLEGGQGVGMTISGQIAGRKILTSVPPVYSERARREGWEGVVAVRFTVLPDGRVKDNVFLEQTSVHRDLNQAALAAIRQFRFAPLAADQGSLEQWGIITIVFRLH